MSSLEARVAKLEKAVGPEESDMCVSVSISPRSGSHLLTDGDASSTKSRPARRRRAGGHVCGPRCVEVSISFDSSVSEGSRGDSDRPQAALPAPSEASTAVGAPSGSGRGDVQRLPESAAAGRDVEQPHSGPPRSPPPAAEPRAGLVDVPARDAVVEIERTAPAVRYPVGGLEHETRCDAESAALWQDVMNGLPWWLPVAEAPLGLCAVPYCEHSAQEHRGIRERLPCTACGFRAEQHDPDGYALEVPQYARRVSPCALYRAICVDEVDSDKCEHPGCGCRGWRRWLPMDPRSELSVLKAQIAERDRIIVENEQKLASLQAEMEAAERELLRATSGPNDLGASPHGCPVYSEGERA